jgi:elongation factor G
MSHGSAGKTTLAEAMLFNTGVLDRLGKVSDGTTTTDYDPEEVKRKISINTAIAPCEWKDCKINVIDTPGYFDFVGEVKQGIRVADSALILVPAKGGVSVGAEKSWAYAKEQRIPAMFFISRMDEENANFFEVQKQLVDIFGKSIIAFQVPIIDGEKFVGIVDVINMKAKKFDKDKLVDTSIPAGLNDKISQIRDALNEAVAETDEGLMEKFFGGEEFTADDISKGLRIGIGDGTIVPVFCGSALNNTGVGQLMDALVEYMPAPNTKPVIKAKKAGTEDAVELKASPDEALSALVFKTIADPFVGKISMFRVYSGTLKSDSQVYNTTSEKTEKIAQVFTLRGKKQLPVDKLIAGDIGAIAKLQYTSTNDTLCDQSKPVILDKIEFPEPTLSLAVEPKTKGDEDKIGSGLQRLQDEDPTLR